jgi:tRNA(Ile)-lysidine synthase TilS/MesJ
MTVFLSQSKKSRSYRVIRPLIDLVRTEVTFLTTLEALPLSVDSTNQKGQSTRSQIRYLLLPLIDRLGFSSFEENADAWMS